MFNIIIKFFWTTMLHKAAAMLLLESLNVDIKFYIRNYLK